MKYRTLATQFVLLATLALPLMAHSQEAKEVWEEYDRLVSQKEAVGTLGPDLLGDQLSFYSGSLSFRTNDVSVPGNSGLPVEITRTFTVQNRKAYAVLDAPLGDWDLDLPNISGVFASQYGWITSTSYPLQRCSKPGTPPYVAYVASDFHPHEYWSGYQMNLPGGGGGELMTLQPGVPSPLTGGPYYWLTGDRTHLSCGVQVQNSGDNSEGFWAITADGTKYRFDWMATFSEPPMQKGRRWPSIGTDTLTRRRIALYATHVEDRFGNWVTYSYSNAPNAPVRLASIQSKDLRSITLGYNPEGLVDQVTAGGRVWRYLYTNGQLSQVIQPDSGRWIIDFSNFALANVRYYKGVPGEPKRNCFDPGDLIEGSWTGVITHPSGARGEFTVAPTRFGRSNVLAMCSNVTAPNETGGDPNDPNDDAAFYPIAWDSLALTRKSITGPGLSPAEWTYSYLSTISYFFGPGGNRDLPVCTSGDCIQPQCVTDSCAGTTTTTVNGPGEFTRYTFGNSYRYNEGKLLKVQRGTGPSSILRTDTNTYELAQSGLPFIAQIGLSPQTRSGAGFVSEFPRPPKQSTISLDGATFESSVEAFDSLARPISTTRSSSLGQSKVDGVEYHDDLSRWVLGQVKRATTDGTEVARTTFHSASVLPFQNFDFGKLHQTITYNADGTAATVADGRNNVTTLSNWKRGIPQSIKHPVTPEAPTGATELAAVSDDGTIASVTDENGYKTCYGYDAMGRLAGITYPSESEATPGVCDESETYWKKKTFAFAPIPAGQEKYGIPANSWQQTVKTGNGYSIKYFDALWRPVVEEMYDNANPSTTRSITVKRYDTGGHLAFQSFPLSSLGSYTDATLKGTSTDYDSLDRVTEVRQNWENDAAAGPLVTTTRYLPGFQVEVTNPRLKVTTTSYMAYDQPTTAWPVAIAQPEGAYTDIVRDVFGKPKALTRRNGPGTIALTRSYVYDGYQQLCKMIEPETSSTVMTYDSAGNLDWTASGQALPNVANCDLQFVAEAQKVKRSYDARNRITSLSFPDGRGNQLWTYTPDSLSDQITTYNGANQTIPVINAYHYNHRRLLDGQGESISQPGWYTWGIGYGYDANGHLASHVYPNNFAVTYLPNALGQPTQVGTFATNVSYWPNGAIKQFTYGNGIVHTLTQNTRGLPDTSCDAYGACGSLVILNDAYDYDANGNVLTITDGVGTAQRGNRDMTYDGLDRLKTAASPMFGATPVSYTYDVLDNFTTVKAPGRDWTYYYSSNRLTNVIDNVTGSTVVGIGYDAQGNLDNKNGQDFDFDFGNRLRAVTGKETYRYDGLGRRVLAFSSLGNILSQYSRAGQLMFQYDQRRMKFLGYMYLGGSLVAIGEQAAPGGGPVTAKYQHTDALGSPVAVTDASRNVIERSEYEPFGKVLVPAVAHDGPGYTGHVYDSLTGLNYMQQRYYDPSIGRFLSVDPVTADGNTGGNFNRYWYANNNPYKFTDPDGRMGQLVIPTIVIGGGMCARNSTCRTAVKAAVATAAAYIGSKLLTEIKDPPANEESESGGSKPGDSFPDRPLPRQPNGEPAPDPEAEGPHTQLGRKEGRNGSYPQAREFDGNGKPVRDIDFTDHGRPSEHNNPHEHPYVDNPTGGTPQRGPERPLPEENK